MDKWWNFLIFLSYLAIAVFAGVVLFFLSIEEMNREKQGVGAIFLIAALVMFLLNINFRLIQESLRVGIADMRRK